MIGSVSQSENAPKITLSDFTEPEELLDKELDTRVIGMCAGITRLLSPLSSRPWVSQPMWAVLQMGLVWRVGEENSWLQRHNHVLKCPPPLTTWNWQNFFLLEVDQDPRFLKCWSLSGRGLRPTITVGLSLYFFYKAKALYVPIITWIGTLPSDSPGFIFLLYQSSSSGTSLCLIFLICEMGIIVSAF